jgi:hypothetical protein
MRALGVGVLCLLLLPVAAAAKSGIELSSAPDGLRAGQPWVVELRGIGERGPDRLPRITNLAVEIENLGTRATHLFRARSIPGGAYRATVVFPTRGHWRYGVAGFDPPGGQRWDPSRSGPPGAQSRRAMTEVGSRGAGSPPQPRSSRPSGCSSRAGARSRTPGR